MLNKLQLNNLIITNKKQIQKGHTQTINKQVQKLRKLKSLLEKHPENEKIKEKYRKATETMVELKKLKRQAIVKHCLVLDKPPSSIVTNGRSTPEEVAIAQLAMNKILRDLLANFKDQLNLNNDDAEAKWKEEIMESSKRRARIQRTEEKRKKRQVVKEQKALTRKRLEWLKDNKTEGDAAEDTNQEDLSVTASGVWKEEESAANSGEEEASVKVKVEKPKKMEKPKKVEKAKKTKKDPIKRPSQQVKPEDSSVNIKVEAKDTVKKPLKGDVANPKREPKPKKEIPDVPPKKVKLEPVAPVKQEVVEEEPAAEEEPFSYVEDPFFITETGESYLSTAVINRNKQNDAESDASDNEDDTAYNRNRYQNRRERNFERLNTTRPSGGGSGRVPEPKAPKIDENLHPSWKAKLKVKPIIGKFQGTKITFNEDGPTQEIVRAAKEVPAKVNGTPKEKLHPSWEAKQKLKPVITSFQGKKITFDNDDA